jgi:LacI family transcriptional regulator
MTEFANALGLSRSTVSSILNDKWRERNIKKATVERVLAYAKEVKFTPNIFGQAMKGKISTDVAVLLSPNIYDHHKQAFFDFISLFSKKNYSYMIFPVKNNVDNTEVINRLVAFKVRNALLFSSPMFMTPEHYEWWRKTMARHPNIRLFFYDYRFESGCNTTSFSQNIGGTGFDRHEAVKLILHYVASAGYRDLLWRGFKLTPEARKYADELGLEISELPRFDQKLELSESGRHYGEFLSKWKKRSKRTAVFISDDIMTIGAVSYLLENGIKVPEDYAFISWDGLNISRYFLKPITTMVVPHMEMIRATADFLSGTEVPRFTKIEPYIRPGKTL